MSGIETTPTSIYVFLWNEFENQRSIDHGTNEVMHIEIINNLGGLDSIVKHCLTDHNYCQQNIKQENIENLKQLFVTEKGHDGDIDDIQIIEAFTDDENKNNGNVDVYNTIHHNLTLTKISSNNCGNQDKISLMGSIAPFQTYHPTFIIDAKRCFYFKHLPLHIASFIYYRILLNKWWIIFLCGIEFLRVTIWSITGSVPIFIAIIFGLIQTCACIAYYLSINIEMFGLITETFDFWFKLYNLTVGFLCEIVLQYWIDVDVTGINLVMAIWRNIFLFFVTALSFFIDGLCVSYKIKIIVSICYGLFLLSNAIFVFFGVNENSDNVNWNPFKQWENSFGKYTNINFKNVYVSAILNLTVFAVKPLFSLVFRKIVCKCLCIFKPCDKYISSVNKNNNSSSSKAKANTDNGQDLNFVQRSTTVYKKPYFEWIHFSPTKISSIQEQMQIKATVSQASPKNEANLAELEADLQN